MLAIKSFLFTQLIIVINAYPISFECAKVLATLGKQVLRRHYKEVTNETLPFFLISGKNINQFGDYEACSRHHQYIDIVVNIKSIGQQFAIGICITKKCSYADLNNDLQWAENIVQELIHLNIKGVIKFFFNQFFVQVDTSSIEVSIINPNEFIPSPSLQTYLIIIFFFLMVTITLVIPCKNFIQNFQPQQEVVEPFYQERNQLINQSTQTRPTLRTLTGSQIKQNRNMESFLTTSSILNLWSEFRQPYEGELGIFNGWRTWSFIMVQFGTFAPIIAVASNPFELIVMMKEFTATILISSFYSVDVFFWMSGFFLVATLQQNQINKKKLFWIPYKLFKRAYRFLPAYLFVIIFFTYLLPQLGSGSRWFLTSFNNCPDVMWQNILFISNFFPENQCVIWGWYISCEFQLFCVGIIIVYIYAKKQYLGKLVAFILLAGSQTYGTIYSFQQGYLIPYYTFVLYGTTIQNNYFGIPYFRAPPYFLGMILGMIYYERKDNRSLISKMKKWGDKNPIKLNLFCYIPGFSIIFYLCFGWYDALINGKDYYPKTIQTLYWSFCRLTFTFGITMLSFKTLLGKKDSFNEGFMNNYSFQLMAKISFCAYLAHYMIQMFVQYNFYEAPNMAILSLLTYYLKGFLIFIPPMSLLLYFFVEQPFLKLISPKIETNQINESLKVKLIDQE